MVAMNTHYIKNSRAATTFRRVAASAPLLAAPLLIALGVTLTPTGATIAVASTDLQSLIPTPAGSQHVDGPDVVHDSGIHMHFLVGGSPMDAMNAYESQLERTGWSLTVQNAGGGHGGGGATVTGTNGAAYGVFTGGGYASTTDVDACVWASKPVTTSCGHH